MKCGSRWAVASALGVCFVMGANISYAETIVHHERSVHRSTVADTRKIEPPSVSAKNVQQKDVEKAVSSESSEKGPLVSVEKKDQSGATSSLPLSGGADIEKNPAIKLTIREGEVNYYTSYYTFDSEQNPDLWLSVVKLRTTTYLSAESFTLFKVKDVNESRLNPPILSKQHPPRLIYRKDGAEQTVVFKKILFLDETGVVYANAFNRLSDVVNSSDVVLEVYREDQQYHRIQIPEEVIQQWKEVLTSDLKKIKQERLNR